MTETERAIQFDVQQFLAVEGDDLMLEITPETDFNVTTGFVTASDPTLIAVKGKIDNAPVRRFDPTNGQWLQIASATAILEARLLVTAPTLKDFVQHGDERYAIRAVQALPTAQSPITYECAIDKTR